MNAKPNPHLLGPHEFAAYMPIITIPQEQRDSLIFAFEAVNGRIPQRSWVDRLLNRKTDQPKRHLPEQFYVADGIVTFVFASDAPIRKGDTLIVGQLVVLKNTIEMDPGCVISAVMPRDLEQGETRIEIIAREIAYGYQGIRVFAELI